VSQTVPSSLAQTVAIAGGGLIGLATAWYLAQLGFRITVFEKSAFGKEASWAGAGMLAPGGELDASSPFATLALESRRLYPGFVRELQRAAEQFVDFQERGALDLAYTQDELNALELRAASQIALGIASKPLSPDQITTFWPHIRKPALVGGRFYPDDAIVDPRDVVSALLKACRRVDVRLMPDCSVIRAAVGERRIQLHTQQGLSEFDFCVVAAGAWSNAIEIEGAPQLPSCEPVRGHLIGYPQPAHTCPTIVRHGHTYLLQRANGLLIAGASVERVGFDRQIDPLTAEALARQAGFVFPHLAETTPEQTWLGFRPGSDCLRLGPWHSRRLLLAYGHYRNGILLAPVTAQRIVALITSSS
jgi:glycine oxidase